MKYYIYFVKCITIPCIIIMHVYAIEKVKIKAIYFDLIL